MIRKALAWVLALAALVSLAACSTGRVVPLEYYTAQITPPRCAAPVVVHAFSDARGAQAIGTTKDGQSFLADPSVPVAEWVGYALYQELKANGCQAQYQTVSEGSPSPIIRGEVVTVDLKQKDSTNYSCAVKIRLTVVKNGNEVMIQQFGSEVDKVYMPSSDNPKKILTECLQVLMGEVMETLLPKLKDI
ncbi:MAG TPA: hypothetical protein DD766_06320 [Desulfovibrio sp.]|jgi:predicted small lipoprotein YifL|nr:hypothetical protein [Desulfovibrio sp.]HBR06635.1 hypothetical protein [Desulfovibrio sp.]